MVQDFHAPPQPRQQPENSSLSLTDQQRWETAFELIKCLVGVPVGEALSVLDEAKAILLDCHTVDPANPRFKAKVEEFGVSQLFSR